MAESDPAAIQRDGGDGWSVHVLDQTVLPFETRYVRLTSLDDAVTAIRTMQVRGAPLIGATAAYGLALALAAEAPTNAAFERASHKLQRARPTAVNLRWAVERMRQVVIPLPEAERPAAAYAEADAIAAEDAATNRAIGEHGLTLLAELAASKPAGEPVNILTHCNTGWLATVDWGTALAPLYLAGQRGISVHVWVEETRPRNQGNLTAFELAARDVPHTVIVDNAGGHLMQRGQVDAVIVGADRVTRAGDVCNKIGTYLKAVAAQATGVPFFVAVPASTIDWTVRDGIAEVPIEERHPDEVLSVTGRDAAGESRRVGLYPPGTRALNVAFDVTPARLVTGFITERGRCSASEAALTELFPEAVEAADG